MSRQRWGSTLGRSTSEPTVAAPTSTTSATGAVAPTLRRRQSRLFEFDHLGSEFLQLVMPQAVTHLGKPVLLLLVRVVGSQVDQHHGLGVEPVAIRTERGPLGAQHVSDVVLFGELQHVLAEVRQQLAAPVGASTRCRCSCSRRGACLPMTSRAIARRNWWMCQR